MDSQYPLSVDGWFLCGWHVLKERTRVLFGGVAVLVVYYIALSIIGMLPGGQILVIIVQLTFGLVLSAGWLYFCLNLVRGVKTSPLDMFEPFRCFSQVWGVSILISLLVAAGLFLFVIPGILIMLRFGLCIFVSVDRKVSPMKALELSNRITSGHRLKLLVLYGIMIGLYGLSVFPYMIEMGSLGAVTISVYNFVITPFLGTAYASAYDSLITPASWDIE